MNNELEILGKLVKGNKADFPGDFVQFVVTDLVLRNGRSEQIAIMSTQKGVFEELVMGINTALKSGGKTLAWQSKVYRIENGKLHNSITFDTIINHDLK